MDRPNALRLLLGAIANCPKRDQQPGWLAALATKTESLWEERVKKLAYLALAGILTPAPAPAQENQKLLTDGATRWVHILTVYGYRDSRGGDHWSGPAWISIDRNKWYPMNWTSECRLSSMNVIMMARVGPKGRGWGRGSPFRAEWIAKQKKLRLFVRETDGDKESCDLNVAVNEKEIKGFGTPPSSSQGAGATPAPSSAALARQGYGISVDEASRLEESLTRDPNDLAARAQLLGYYFAAGGRRLSAEAARQARLRHILWLVQNHPESELAGLPPATIDPTGHPLADQEGYEKVKALWLEQAEKHKDNPVVLANAAWFFKLPDKPIAAQLLKRAQAVDPGNRNWSGGLGFVYAAGIVGLTGMNENGFATRADPDEARGSFAQQAREELAKSQDAALVGKAGDRLSFWGAILSASGKAPPDYLDLAEQLLGKAQALDPGNQEWAQLLAQVYAQRALKGTSTEERAALARKRLETLEKGPDTIKLGLSTLTDLARAAFDAGEFEKAETYARRLLEVASQNRSDFYYGAALHHGNLILGRLALRAGDVQKAKSSLLAAGRTPGGPQLSSFGPNMSLAKELLERGEKQAVLEYLELCKRFWTSPRNPLDLWIETIKSGGTPNFGANLIY